jgi:DNA mismatch repair protein MutS2
VQSGESADLRCPIEPGLLKEELSTRQYLAPDRLIVLKNWFNYLHKLEEKYRASSIKSFFNKFGDYQDIIFSIQAKIDDNGQIFDNASPSLFTLRKQKKRLNNEIRKILTKILDDRQSIFSGTDIVEREGRYVLPVLRNFKNDLKGIIHAYSNSGETVFIEPVEITDTSARLQELDEQERYEIEQILKALTQIIRGHEAQIEKDINTMIDLDMLFAKVKYARDTNASMPVFMDSIKIINGFHPVLQHLNGHIVALNFMLNHEKRILLISGPNAGGKTVVLKTIGLLALMAKCGLFIPVEEGSCMPFYPEIYADIGDEQSIESNLSTFAAHIKQIRSSLEGSSDSLVLLDELMSQTSVEEGSALAVAILEKFAAQGNTVLATTHNEELKIFASRRDDMMNGGMEFTDRPTYHFIPGIPQPSNAIKLAKRLGISKDILTNAMGRLDKDKMSINSLFEDLSRELKSVREEKTTLSDLINEYETKLSILNYKKKEELSRLQEKYKHELIISKRSIEKLIKDLKKTGPKPELVHSTREFFKKRFDISDNTQPYYPELHEMVQVRELKRAGQVVEVHQGKYKVSLDNIFYWVGPEDIEKAGT